MESSTSNSTKTYEWMVSYEDDDRFHVNSIPPEFKEISWHGEVFPVDTLKFLFSNKSDAEGFCVKMGDMLHRGGESYKGLVPVLIMSSIMKDFLKKSHI